MYIKALYTKSKMARKYNVKQYPWNENGNFFICVI